MEQDNPSDLSRLRMDPAQIQRKAGRPKRWQRHYVHVPWEWVVHLRGTKRAATVMLALLLAYEHWRMGGRVIVLSNALAADVGLSRRSKWSALVELERRGLVEVERCPGKSPRVTIRLARRHIT
jgi:hypothetical protein